MYRYDLAAFEFLNHRLACAPLDWLMPRITSLHQRGAFLAVVAIAAIALIWRGPARVRAWVLCALVAVALSDTVAYRGIKAVAPRVRPCQTAAAAGGRSVPDVRVLPGERCPGSPSFPSNHAANMAAVGAVGWWFTRRRARWAWLLLPLIIGYSRIYLGYHYPSDVLGGWVLGGAMAALCIRVAQSRGAGVPAAPEA